jgi:hypothetical protein
MRAGMVIRRRRSIRWAIHGFSLSLLLLVVLVTVSVS